MHQLFVAYGTRLPNVLAAEGEPATHAVDLLVAAYPAGVEVRADAHPGCVRIPYAGVIESLERIGPAPAHGVYDMRPRRAPALDLAAYAEQQWRALLARGVVVNVADETEAPVRVLCDGTNDTRADLSLLVLFGQDYPTGEQVWTDNAGVETTLTGVQCVRLATMIGMWVGKTYPALNALQRGAKVGTITRPAEVDAAFAALAP